MGRTSQAESRERKVNSAFTLLEVMVAVAIFFMAIFAILELTTHSLKAARALKQSGPTAGMVAAELSMTNKLEEGSMTGDFGDLYPDYNWSRDIAIYGTNGMFQVDIIVFKHSNPDSALSLLLYRPESGNNGPVGGRKVFQNR
ncbi:MAG: type IV pilus modification PilV family protein [Limisphaerales bacterium]